MAVLLVSTGALNARPAEAQLPAPPDAPSEADVARARDAFVRGMEHARAEAWDEATVEFLDSYRLSGSPVALLNAGTSLSALGRHRDATEALLRVLHEETFDERTRRGLERALRDSSRHVGILTLHGIPERGARWSVDGAPRGPVEVHPLTVVLDPGPHRVTVQAPDRAPWVWDGRLAPAERIERNVVLDEQLDGATDPDGSGGAGGGGDDVALWVVLGVGAGLLVAGVVSAFAIDAAVQLDPRSPFVVELP